jgi:hypothetical protein
MYDFSYFLLLKEKDNSPVHVLVICCYEVFREYQKIHLLSAGWPSEAFQTAFDQKEDQTSWREEIYSVHFSAVLIM